jgi:hypothetical protein
VTREELQAWLESYERLWRTEGTDGLSEIFTPDAFYSNGPYEDPFEDLDEIAEMWDEERRSADEEFSAETEILAVDGETGVVRVQVDYGGAKPQQYRDIWIVRLNDDGRCFHFEEWPFWPELSTTPPSG